MRKASYILAFALLTLFPAISFAACNFAGVTGCDLRNPATGDLQIFYAILCRVNAYVASSMCVLYINIANAAQLPVKIFCSVYIMFYCMGFMFGVVEAKGGDMVFRIMKVVMVMLFATNADFMFDNLYTFFMSALHSLSMLIIDPAILGPGGPNPANNNLFMNMDVLFNQIVGLQGLKLLWALAIAFALTGGGMMVSILIAMGVLAVIYAMIKLFVTFAIAIISLTFTLLFTPIFMIFLLFGETRDLFDNWLGLLVTYTLQPVIILFYLAVMGEIIDINNYLIPLTGGLNTNIDACTGTVTAAGIIVPYCFRIDLIFFELVRYSLYQIRPGVDIFMDYPVTIIDPITGVTNTYQMPLFVYVITNVLLWVMMSYISVKFAGYVPQLASRLGVMGGAPIVPQVGSIAPSMGGASGLRTGGFIVMGGTSVYEGDSSPARAIEGAAYSGLAKGRQKLIVDPIKGAARVTFRATTDFIMGNEDKQASDKEAAKNRARAKSIKETINDLNNRSKGDKGGEKGANKGRDGSDPKK